MRTKGKIKELIRMLIMPFVMIVAVICLISAVGNLEKGQSRESKKQVEDAINKAVLNCYAVEGRYPATFEYMEEHYGLQIDHDRYEIFYEIFADNLMPSITVIIVGE